MRFFLTVVLPLCAINAQEHLLVTSHVSGTVLGAGDSERQDRNSQLVGKSEMQYRGFCGKIKIICRGLPGVGW